MRSLAEIRSMAVDINVPLSNVLLECIRVAMERDLPELKLWAMKEINGYGVEDELPEYRILPGGLRALADNGFRKDVLAVPDELFKNIDWYDPHRLEIRQGIQELELLDPGERYQAYVPESIRAWVQKHIPHSIYVSVYHELLGASANSILVKIRTRVLAFLDGLIDEKGEDLGKMLFPDDLIAKKGSGAITQHITLNSGANMTVAQHIDSNINVAGPVKEGDWNSLSRYLVEQGVSEEDVDELKAILDELGTGDVDVSATAQTEEWTEKVSESLVSGSSKVLREAATQMVSGALLQYFGFGS